MIALSRLLQDVPGAHAEGSVRQQVTGVVCDSRLVREGSVFVAIDGVRNDGHTFVASAVQRGAAAIVVHEEWQGEMTARVGDHQITWVTVPNCALALSRMTAAWSGYPSGSLRVTGVTGTNGKTTTTYLLDHMLRAAGMEVGVFSTIAYRVGARHIPATHTTPPAPMLHSLLADLVRSGAEHAVIEVSSHALCQRRVDDVQFDVGVLTNVTRDHLDYHGNDAAYREAKGRLFTALAPSATAILRAADSAARVYSTLTRARVLWYGGPDSDVTLDTVVPTTTGWRGQLQTPLGVCQFQTQLQGAHNLENIMAAVGAAVAYELPLAAITEGIASLVTVPGRLERIDQGQPFQVYVDYAHTDDGLARVLHTLVDRLPARGARLIVVFGCGGDRDRGKRARMGQVASQLAGQIILTSDNPRNEDPERILDDIEAGLADAALVERVVDRGQAIQRAIQGAAPGDVVLIAGKGHETYQTFNDVTIPFDDRAMARQCLAAGGYAAVSEQAQNREVEYDSC